MKLVILAAAAAAYLLVPMWAPWDVWGAPSYDTGWRKPLPDLVYTIKRDGLTTRVLMHGDGTAEFLSIEPTK